MKLKLKQLAAVGALACVALPSYSAINVWYGDAEMFGMVWDEQYGTYVIDFGVTYDKWNAGFTGTLGTVGGADWDKYVAADVDGLNDFERFEGTRWSVVLGAQLTEYNGAPEDKVVYSTTTNSVPSMITDQQFEGGLADSFNFFYTPTVNQNGMVVEGGGPSVHNDDIFAPVGSPAHFIEYNANGVTGLYTGNAIGTTQGIQRCTYGSFYDYTAMANCSFDPLRSVTFDGTTFSVTAVPEPGTYALLLAGLGLVGAVARRRA